MNIIMGGVLCVLMLCLSSICVAGTVFMIKEMFK